MTGEGLFDGTEYDTVPVESTESTEQTGDDSVDSVDSHPDPVPSGLRQRCAFLGGPRGQTKVRETGEWLLLTGGAPLGHLVYRRQGDGAKAACGRIGGVLQTDPGELLPTCPKCYATT